MLILHEHLKARKKHPANGNASHAEEPRRLDENAQTCQEKRQSKPFNRTVSHASYTCRCSQCRNASEKSIHEPPIVNGHRPRMQIKVGIFEMIKKRHAGEKNTC